MQSALHGASVYGPQRPGLVRLAMVSAVADGRRETRERTRGSPSRSGSTSSRARRSGSTRWSSTRRSCARSRARRTPPARGYVDVLYSDQHVRRAHIEQAADDDARLLAAVARRAARRVRRDGRRAAARSPATRSPSSSPTSTASASARRACARSPRRSLRADRRALQLVDRRLPERGLGADGLRRARRRAALGGGRARPSGSTSPTRSRPGASTSTGSSSAPQSLNERRFDHLRYRGPGTDLTIGLHPGVRVAGGARRVAAGSSTSRTCRPRRSSRRRTRAASRARSARRCRCRSRAPSCATSRCASRAAARSRCAPTSGEEVMRTHVATDDGAARLGEVALVDGHSARRPDRARLLRHAVRRERGVAHRARRGDRAGGRLGAASSRRRSATSAASTTRRSTPTS